DCRFGRGHWTLLTCSECSTQLAHSTLHPWDSTTKRQEQLLITALSRLTTPGGLVPLEIPTVPGGNMKAQWTHLALHVKSLKAIIEFYERSTILRLVDWLSDASSTGMDVAWMSEGDKDGGLGFVMVLQEGEPTVMPGAKPQLPIGPMSH